MALVRSGTQHSQLGDPGRFHGQVWNELIGVGEDPARLRVARVTFTPGSRTAWHSHPHGQILIAVHGSGLTQRAGHRAVTLSPGDSVSVAPGERHWHGAGLNPVFVQLSVQGADDAGEQAAWYQQVDAGEYAAAARPGGDERF